MDALVKLLDSQPEMERPADGNAQWNILWEKINCIEEDHGKKCVLIDIKEDSNETLQTWLTSCQEDKCNNSMVVDVCIEALERISSSSQSPYALILPENVLLSEAVIDVLSRFGKQVRHKVVKKTLEQQLRFPLELLWRLQLSNVVQITTYIITQSHSWSDLSQHLCNAMVWFATQSDYRSANCSTILVDVISVLLISSMGRSQEDQNHLASSCISILKNFVEEVVNWLLNLPAKSTDSNLDYLSKDNLLNKSGEESLQWFSLEHLHQLLTAQTLPTSTSACEVIKSQDSDWTVEASPKPLIHILHMAVEIVGVEEITRHLKIVVVKPEVNWRVVLLTTSVLLEFSPEVAGTFEILIDDLLCRGLERGKKAEAIAAFYLARQCCKHRCAGYKSYAFWFSSHFGSGSTKSLNDVQFQTLMEILTDFVPFENGHTLRVHLNKVPTAPKLCYSTLSDYVSLAKTRLADFNESIEICSLFSDPVSNKNKDPQSDIARALEHFGTTGKVMKPVLEASCFHFQYFTNVFLRDLLQISNDENTFSKDSVRHQFILKLREMRKIPDKLFSSYMDKISNRGGIQRTESELVKQVKESTLTKNTDNDGIRANNQAASVEKSTVEKAPETKKKRSLKLGK